jgi:hypothetical protein
MTTYNEGSVIVTVARAGARCATVRRGKCVMSFPLYVIATYEARKRQRDGALTWRRVGSHGEAVACDGSGPSGALLVRADKFARDAGLPYEDRVRHGERVAT